MTDERRNEIWAMLTQSEKKGIVATYNQTCFNSKYKMGCNHTLEWLFGKHNLTAQAEEKPKEPRFKVGDKVSYFGQDATIFKAHDNGYDVIFYNGATLYNLPEEVFNTYSTPKSESKINEENGSKVLNVADNGNLSTKEDAYFAYRLNLAKEIAVAVIQSDRWDFHSCNPVEQANEIVKRLKETEE